MATRDYKHAITLLRHAVKLEYSCELTYGPDGHAWFQQVEDFLASLPADHSGEIITWEEGAMISRDGG